jgi:hypothetical protein
MLDIKHKILLILLSLTIIGEALSIIIWTNVPRERFTLTASWEIAVINAVIMIPLNLMALFWIKKRSKSGPLFLIVISIGNRIASQLIFNGGMHLIFVTWTALLVVFAYLEYRKLNNFEALFLVGGVIFALIAAILIFTVTGNSILGVIAYTLVLALVIGTLTAIKKVR